jgi:hypothetical protein
MNVYVCTDHEGHWPVGVCSVVVAASEDEARELLAAELHTHGLHKEEPFTLWQVSLERQRAMVLLDGDY